MDRAKICVMGWILVQVGACAASKSSEDTKNLPWEPSFYPEIADSDKAAPDDEQANNPWLRGFAGNSSSMDTSGDRQDDSSTASSHQPIIDTEEHGTSNLDEGTTAAPDPDEPSVPRHARLIFAEYKEGQASDKRLGLVNLGEGVDGKCEVRIYANGGHEPWRTIKVETLPPPSQTAVFCTASETGSGCTHAMSANPYNGNDALVLDCDGTITDSLGQVGVDPGSAWRSRTDALMSTKDSWLIRCINEPDLNPNDEFWLDETWIQVDSDEAAMQARVQCPSNGGGFGGAHP